MCGLTADLLPVVSNPHAAISPSSDMKQMGKTPSQYNGRQQVVGIATWTTTQASAEDVRGWAEQPDYGICVQTRRVRALDLDVDNAAQVAEIETFVRAVLGKGVALAVRRRPNSTKCLIAFEVTDIPADQDLFKRTVKTEHGMIEFLATGQQFIAYGTHPSGVRYVWENEGEFPDIPLHAFEKLWEKLCARFGIGEPTNSAARKRGLVLKGVTDRIACQLEDKGLVVGWGRDGQAHITCPFADEHSTASALSATSYFPAGTGGYELGHFKCLHAHCAHRTDQDFMDKLAISIVPKAAMAMLATEPELDDIEPVPPTFKRNDKGDVEAIAKNIELALETPHVCGYHIAKDTFLEEVMLRRRNLRTEPACPWRALQDEDYMEIRIHLESQHRFQNINSTTLRDCLHVVARRNQFDSASAYVRGLQWDGTPRVDRFFTDYIKTTDPVFGKAVARYLFTAMAGRALTPGIKADMVPMLIGPQGIMKTSAIEALSPIEDVFAEISLQQDEASRVRLIKGKMIVEIGEMRGLWGSQIEDVKAFITKRHDKWVPKYKEQSVTYPRRCVFIGTGNHHDILNDPTGTRRFLPMTVEDVDLEAIRRDALQLWAEGKEMFALHGIIWQDAQRLGAGNNAAYTAVDPWVEMVGAWLSTRNEDGKTILQTRGGVLTSDVLVNALGHTRAQANPGVGKRVAEVMRALGLTRRGDLWVRPAEGEPRAAA